MNHECEPRRDLQLRRVVHDNNNNNNRMCLTELNSATVLKETLVTLAGHLLGINQIKCI